MKTLPTRKTHYKMYKKGRFWVIAGITALTWQTYILTAQAATDDSATNTNTNTATTSTASATSQDSVALKTPTSAAAASTTASQATSAASESTSSASSNTSTSQATSSSTSQAASAASSAATSSATSQATASSATSASTTAATSTTTSAVSSASVDNSKAASTTATTKAVVESTPVAASAAIAAVPASTAVTTEVHSGTFEGGATWSLSDDGILTIGAGGLDALTKTDSYTADDDKYHLEESNIIDPDTGEVIGQTEVKVPNNIWKQYFDITKVKTINFTGEVTANADSSGLFIDMTNLTTINNANLLDMSQVTNMNNMFYRDTALESVNVSNWDVSNVTSMYSTFNDTKSLKALDVSNWNVSKVQNMANLFWGNAALTELDVSKWVTSSVTNLAYVFDGLTNVTTLDVSNWDTSKATTMAYMFYNSGISSLDTSKWVTSSVTNMAGMFGYATKLTTITGIENWNTSKVTNMSYLFSNAHALNNIDLSKWDTTSAKNMAYMFNQTLALTSVDVSNFDTSKVKNMQAMFSNAQALTAIDVSQWHTGSVTNFNNMFSYTKGLTTALNVANWDTTNAVDMSHMFYASEVTALDVSNWQTGNVTDMSYLFGTTSGVTSKLTTLNVANWDTSSVINMAYMFARTTALKALDVTKWNTSNVTNMAYMFSRATQLKALAVDSWDVGNVTNMSYMFFVDSALTSLDLSAWDTHSVTTTSSMFSEDKKLATLKFGNWKTDSLTDISYMFYDMAALTSLDLSGWTTTGNVTNMGFAFSNTGLTALDLANWTTTSVDNNGTTGVTNANDYGLGSLFAGSKALKSLDISNFTISDDLNISKMLSGTTALNALTLGTGARLKNSTGNATLTDLTSDLYYTGNWVKSDEQTTGPTYTSTNLMSAYDGTAPGTYVWQDRVSLADLTTDPTVTLYANPQSEETWSPVEAVTKVIDVYGDDVDKSTLTTTITDSQNNPVDNIQLNSADTYTVTYQYKDQLGVTHSAKTVVTVKANQADLTLNQTTDNLVDGDTLNAAAYFKSATNVDGTSVAYGSLSVTATKDGQTINSLPATVSAGTYILTYDFIDQQNNHQTATLKLSVDDNRVGLQVDDQTTLTAGDTWTPETAFISATDTDGSEVTFANIGVKITKNGENVSAVDTSKAGTYLVTYSFMDSQGKPQQATSTVTVKANLVNLEVAEQTNLVAGNTWTPADNFKHATDTDGSDVPFDNLTVAITKAGQTVNTDDPLTAGTYLVTYSFNDQQGNLQQATSTVIVTDSQAGLKVNKQVTLATGDTWQASDQVNSATDTDGSVVHFDKLTVSITKDGQTVTSIDTSTTGTYLVTYSFTDQQGNLQQATSTVTITNNQAQISVIPETDLTVGDSWTPADNFKGATDVDGTAVTFNQLTVTVSRLARDGQPLTSVDTSQPGRYLVTYSFTDQQGQVQTATSLITITAALVKDQSSLSVQPNVTLTTGDTWTPADGLVTATDTDGHNLTISDLTVTITKDGQSIADWTTANAGDYLITYAFTDQTGQAHTATATVTITAAPDTGNTDNGGDQSTDNGDHTTNNNGNETTPNDNTGSTTDSEQAPTTNKPSVSTNNTTQNTLHQPISTTTSNKSQTDKPMTATSHAVTKSGTEQVNAALVAQPVAVSKHSSATTTDKKTSPATLPQTDETTSPSVTLLGTILLGLSSLLAFLGLAPKRRHN